MAALNHERWPLTIQQKTYKMVQKISLPAKLCHFGKLYCVEDMVRRKEQSFENRGTRTGSAEHLN